MSSPDKTIAAGLSGLLADTYAVYLKTHGHELNHHQNEQCRHEEWTEVNVIR